MTTKNTHICRGCGKEIEINESAVRVQTGKLRAIKRKTVPSEKTIWGYMHERCFVIAIGDQEGLRNIAKAS